MHPLGGHGRENSAMTTWIDVEAAVPDLAGRVRARFEASGLALVATVRADGSPRISGWEPLFDLGHLWLGSMPDSRKGADARRDPRIALHSATADKDVKEGDAKISGQAVLVTDEAERLEYSKAFQQGNEIEVPTPFDLFRVEVTEISMLRPADDHLVIEWWRPGEELHRIERR
jgi:nitroimidazol reductase NimA-like FMN-containing flavoprotein (pyridoxamine 5'-phosphate oxidase superfamily)